MRRLIAYALPLMGAAVRTLVAQVPLPADALHLLRADAAREAVAAATLEGERVPARALFSLRRDIGDVVRVDAFIRAKPGTETALRALGIRVGLRAGEWLTAQIPLERLAEAARVPGVRSLELSRRAKLRTDSSMLAIGAATVRRRVFEDQFEGSTGRGVIVGFVDSGIDFAHADFIEDGTGRSRIVSIWDQTQSGPGPAGMSFGYGRECLREELGRDGTCGERDTNGHGTHVAGIAVSDGSESTVSGSPYAYPGVAPGAELVMVKSDLSFTSIVNGVAYVFERARQMGLPAVVNLSLGTQLGPHDGDEAPSLALDALSGAGRIVVAAAGNEGNNRNLPTVDRLTSYHAEGVASVSGSTTMTFRVFPYTPSTGSGNDLALVQIYYHTNDRFSVAVTRPNGTVVTVGENGSVTSNESNGALVLYNGTIAGDSILGSDLEAGSFSTASTARVAELYLGEWINGGAPPAPGVWRVTLTRTSGTGNGVVDGWISESSLLYDPSFETGATNRKLVGPPGDARTVIAVGAYSTRTGWSSVDGNRYVVTAGDSVASGDLLPFSSPGPTRDGRLKPEIAAPGRVFSALTTGAFFPIPLVSPDSHHVVFEGTSMSTPHVTGAVALLLSRRPTLTPAQALAALANGALHDAFTTRSFAGDAGTPNNSWGWGKLFLPTAIPEVAVMSGRGFMSGGPITQRYGSSRKGTLIPLQRLRLTATDAESLLVNRLVARVRGNDPAFSLAIIVDDDHDGVFDSDERMISGASPPAPLAGEAVVTFSPYETPIIPQGGVLDLILAARMSGSVANGATFTAAVMPESSLTTGVRTRAVRTLTGDVASGLPITTSVLKGGERYAVSQNPVRQAPLVFNMAERTDRIDIFDFAGRRVRVLRPAATDRSIRWDLRADDGRELMNGTYVVVIHLASGAQKQKLFVTR